MRQIDRIASDAGTITAEPTDVKSPGLLILEIEALETVGLENLAFATAVESRCCANHVAIGGRCVHPVDADFPPAVR
jgi:hypothetical protein